MFLSLQHIASEIKGKELLKERKYKIVNNTQSIRNLSENSFWESREKVYSGSMSTTCVEERDYLRITRP